MELETILESIKNAMSLLPDDLDIECGNDDFKCHVTKNNGVLTVAVDEPFDDSEIKEIVKNYKKAIEDLDDDTFIAAVEDFNLDLKKFNDLLDLEHYNKSEAQEVETMIADSSEVICKYLQDDITRLVNLYDRF